MVFPINFYKLKYNKTRAFLKDNKSGNPVGFLPCP